MAGLIESEARAKGIHLSVSEVRQLMASGTIGDQTQADDVNFANDPEPSCSVLKVSTCTDPNLAAPGAFVLPHPGARRYRLTPLSWTCARSASGRQRQRPVRRRCWRVVTTTSS